MLCLQLRQVNFDRKLTPLTNRKIELIERETGRKRERAEGRDRGRKAEEERGINRTQEKGESYCQDHLIQIYFSFLLH